MKITQKCHYALLALLDLARRKMADPDDRRPVKILSIAESRKIPEQFLQAILRELKGGGMVESHRGKAGGYRLAKEADAISVAEVVTLIDGPPFFMECAGKGGCDTGRASCALQELWRRAADDIERTLGQSSIGDLARREVELNGCPPDGFVTRMPGCGF